MARNSTNIMVKCSKCSRLLSSENLAKHEASCKGMLFANRNNLRDYLKRNVIKHNPQCPICNHKLFAAITKAIIDGEANGAIVSRYSGKRGGPTFSIKALINHKNHLSLDLVTVLERNNSLTLPLPNNPDGLNNPIKFTQYNYMQTIAKAVVDKSHKIDALIMSQLAKLEIANALYNKMKSMDFIGDRTAQLYLSYLSAVDDIQVKILNYYKQVPTLENQNVSTKLLWGVIYSMQKEALGILISDIVEPSLRLEISVKVGEVFDKHNSQLEELLKEALTTDANSRGNLTQELIDGIRGSIYDAEFIEDIPGGNNDDR